MTDVAAESEGHPDVEDVRVFVSYSRKNTALVDRLSAALASRAVIAVIDRAQIADLEEWWNRISELVSQAHSVVFVLSQHWVESETCRKELALGVEMHKRLAPVVWQHEIPSGIPRELAQLNWISLNDETFEAGVDKLVAAVRTDIEWVREQARLTEQARHWELSGRPDGSLLRSDVLLAAEQWLAKRPATAPPATEGLFEYLRVARAVHEREEQARKDLLDRTQISQSRMLADRARQLLDRGDSVSALLLCLEALPDESRSPRPMVTAAAVMCYRALRAQRERRVFSHSDGGFTDAAFSEDGTRLIGLTGKGICVWDTASGTPITTLEAQTILVAADGKRAISLDGATVRVWKLDAGSAPLEKRTCAADAAPPLETLLPHSPYVWAEREGWFEYWSLSEKGPLQRTVPSLKGGYDRVSWSPDGLQLVATPAFTFAFPTTVEVWKVRPTKRVARLKGHESYVRFAVFSSDGSRVATTSADQTARVWHAATGKLLHTLRGHENDVAWASFSPDGTMLLTGSYDNSFCLWQLESGARIATLRGHAGDVPKTTDIFRGFTPRGRFSADGRQVVTTWKDGTVRLWDVEPGAGLHAVLSGHEKAINSVAFAPDGQLFVTASDDERVVVWDARTRASIRMLRGVNERPSDVTFSPDGGRIAAAVGDAVIIWDAATGKKLSRIACRRGAFRLAFTPDGQRLGVTSLLEGATILDIRTTKEVVRFTEGDPSYGIAFAPSGLVAASCGDERAIRLWRTRDGKQIASVILHGHSVLGVAFDAAGRRIVTACDDHTSRIWTIGTEPSDENVVVLSGHDAGVNSASFSPTGGEVVTASQDGTVRLWESATGELIDVFRGHTASVRRAVFGPAGDHIISVSEDATVRAWQVFCRTADLIAEAKRSAPRVLTRQQRESFFLDPVEPDWYRSSGKWPYQSGSST